MQITRDTLYAINDVCNYTESMLDDLRDMLDLLNISNEEKELLLDGIVTVETKISDVKDSKITDLGDHIDDSINNIGLSRY